MRGGAGKRLLFVLLGVAAPAVCLAIYLLPPLPAAAASVAAIAASAWFIARRLDERHGALLGVLRRLSAGDYAARAPSIYGLGPETNRLAERIGGAVFALSRDKSQLEAVLDQMSEAVLAVDSAGAVLVVNPSLSRLLGVDAAASRGRPYLECVRHNAISQLVGSVLKDGRPLALEVRVTAREELIFDAHAAPLLQEGKLAGALLVLHDITRLRRLEQVRRDFVANVSHELRTPLSSIKGYAETLREGAIDDKENRLGFVKTIEEQADRLSKLVDDLLDLSAVESGHRLPKLAPTDLAALTVDVSRQFAAAASDRGVALETGSAGPAIALADAEQVRQVVVNLIDNAIKYTETGGRVEISLETRAAEVIVSVRDTGVGIPEADLARVFERFYRVDKARARDAGGTGLGLAIVKHLVEAQGGRVWVESRQPGGSTFRFALRAA
jgi:two-component system phosphate regulon sensor histidine kinase PhoR